MILKIFTVFDAAAEAYMQPFFQHNRGIAIRSFSEAANDASQAIGKYPADFTLFEVGEYDDQNCSMTMLDAKRNLGTALEFRNPDPEEK